MARASSITSLTNQLRKAPSYLKRGGFRDALTQQFSIALSARSELPRTRQAMKVQQSVATPESCIKYSGILVQPVCDKEIVRHKWPLRKQTVQLYATSASLATQWQKRTPRPDRNGASRTSAGHRCRRRHAWLLRDRVKPADSRSRRVAQMG